MDKSFLYVLLLGGAGYYLWKTGKLPSINNILTPSSVPLTNGAVVSASPRPDDYLELFPTLNYAANGTTLTGAHTDGPPFQIKSIRTHGQPWVLYANANYTGQPVSTNGYDYPDATKLLEIIGGVIGSAKRSDK